MKKVQLKVSTKSLLTAVEALLSHGSISTQEEIRQALLHQGIDINQSRISRLLRKLSVIKMLNSKGESVYALPKESSLSPKNGALSQLIKEIAANEAQVVIHTNPGSASLIAGILDDHRKTLKILGTVAGDDVLLVIPESITQTENLLKAIKAQFFD